MYVVVKVREDIANLLQGCEAVPGRGPPEHEELMEAAKDMGIVFEPMYPDEDGSELASYFIVEVLDLASAENAMLRLLRCRAVESASLAP